MSWKDLFKLSNDKDAAQMLPSRDMDSFADNVLFELKTVTTVAITQALEARESNYMRSILDESYFLLESLVIKALDAQAIKDMESFLSNHKAIDPEFRRKFFSKVLQREYRSKRGASVRVDPQLEPIVEFAANAFDDKTDDETFIITLKGRQIRFEAQAVLQGPISKNKPNSANFFASGATQSGLAQAVSSSMKLKAQDAKAMIHLTLHDRRGTSEQVTALPITLGREGKRWAQEKGGLGIDVDATYVSRQQLVIFELLGNVYFFVPSSASLTCTLATSTVLRPDQLYALPSGQSMTLHGGIPVGGNDHAPASRDQHADFPVFVLRFVDSGTEHNEATPRPKAVM